MINVEYAELHTPLFLAGTNLGMKLDPYKRRGMLLKYNDEKRRLIVEWNSKTANVPESNVASWVEGDVLPDKPVAPGPKRIMVAPAQVETPQAHVHAGPGHGKTGK